MIRIRFRSLSSVAGILFAAVLLAGTLSAQSAGPPAIASISADPEPGIPIADPLVIAKCGTCHTRDDRGNIQRISWTRSTPEGWQDVIRRMALQYNVPFTQPEALKILRYLSNSHGLTPSESKPVMYFAERRVRDESGADDPMNAACAKCHSISRALLWRRSATEWKQYADSHAATYKFRPNELAVMILSKSAPLHTPDWDSWSSRGPTADFTGRWLLTAYIPGRGRFSGEMRVDHDPDGDFTTRVNLTSIKDGSKILRTGRSSIYGDAAWRGRSTGSPPAASDPDTDPGNPSREVREVMLMAPDHLTAQGRWFWGRYQELGFDVQLQRPSAAPTLLAVDRPALKLGSQSSRIRLIGDHFPEQVARADLALGPGVTVRSIVSHTESEIVAAVDVAADALAGKRDVVFKTSRLPGAIAIYDRVDYMTITPQSAMASFSDASHTRGYRQFEATGFQRGPDGKLHTADDVDLGAVDVVWSVEVFHEAPGGNSDFVGTVSPAGLFSPAAVNPNGNFDVWVIATAVSEKDLKGEPLTDKCYLVVTVPTYTFNGRKYVRDLDRWADDGPASGAR